MASRPGCRAKCPAKTRIGKAVGAVSPVLNKQLSGPVYFVQGIRIDPTLTGRKDPDAADPARQAQRRGPVINVRATTTVVKTNKLVSEFARTSRTLP